MIIANWKCNGNLSDVKSWMALFDKECLIPLTDTFIGLAPPTLYFHELLKYAPNIRPLIGVQDVDYTYGARTGAISVDMLDDIDCAFSLIGHSERRELYFEDNDIIKEKLKSLNNRVMAVLCIGETKEENDKGITKDILKEQLDIVNGLELDQSFTVAYEPVWAIGSGLTPEPKDINEIHKYIKDVVQSNTNNSANPSVLYGGSVNSANAASFFNEDYVDGALVGGAALDGSSFAEIVNIFNGLKQ